jgi:glycosyltransferase involved in cell wall biosynthesis
MKPELTIIIPVYNEADLLSGSLDAIRGKAASCAKDYAVLVIDDGSTDDTWRQIEEYREAHGDVAAIRLSRNFGKEHALCAGLELVESDAVIVMDADLQHPPELIPKMYRLWKDGGFDIVECVKRDRGKEPLMNRWGSRLFYYLLNRLSGYQLHGASDFKLLDGKVVQAWRAMPERNTFFRGMTAWIGFQRAAIEFEVPERNGGKSRWTFIGLLKLAIKAVLAFTSFPLRIVSVIGGLFLLGAVILGMQTLIRKLMGAAVTGFTTVILLQLIIGSIIMVSLGIIGEYIAAIYNETKGRPRYIVRERLNTREAEDRGHLT